MGQAMKTLAAGAEEKKAKEIGPIIEDCYKRYFSDPSKVNNINMVDFYRAVCETITFYDSDINKKLGNTQFRVPSAEVLKNAFENHHRPKTDSEGKPLPVTKEEFGEILRNVLLGTEVTGIGAKDILFYIFGVPAAALIVKQTVIPALIPNEVFIPGITSITVFVLAKLNKI